MLLLLLLLLLPLLLLHYNPLCPGPIILEMEGSILQALLGLQGLVGKLPESRPVGLLPTEAMI